MKTVFIIGGTSGLGLELAQYYASDNARVHVVGRTNPHIGKLSFSPINLAAECTYELERFVENNPKPDILIWTAGFYQEGHIGDLKYSDIIKMTMIGITNFGILMNNIMRIHGELTTLVTITSTSAYMAREFEPVYAGVKAGLVHMSESLSLDPHIQKTLTVAPSGMATPFWKTQPGKDISTMLNPTWVAEQIIEQLKEDYSFRSIKILREPNRIETTQERI